jgi:hypothetical protein
LIRPSAERAYVRTMRSSRGCPPRAGHHAFDDRLLAFLDSLISELCKTYQKFYDTNPRDSEMHEEILSLMATAIGKAEAGFFRDNGSH